MNVFPLVPVPRVPHGFYGSHGYLLERKTADFRPGDYERVMVALVSWFATGGPAELHAGGAVVTPTPPLRVYAL